MPTSVRQWRALNSISSAKVDNEGAIFTLGLVGGVDEPPPAPAPTEPPPTKPGIVSANEPFGLKVTLPLSGSGTLRLPRAPPGPQWSWAAGHDCAWANPSDGAARTSPAATTAASDGLLSITIDLFHFPSRASIGRDFATQVIYLFGYRGSIRARRADLSR